MNIHGILAALIALGPKLPVIIARVESIIEEVRGIIADMHPETPDAIYGACEMTAGEAALCEQAENQLAACSTLYAGPGDRIKNLLAFFKEHPELVQLILSLLK